MSRRFPLTSLAMLEEVGLADRANEWPSVLSGGQRQRVALADRVIVIEEGRIALDLDIPLPRPRRHGSAELARLEGVILERLLGKQDG